MLLFRTLSLRTALPALLVVLFCTGGLAHGDTTEAFIDCIVAEGSGGSMLALNSRTLEGKTFFTFYFTDDDSRWQKGLRYPATLTALALHNGRLYALGPDGAAEYHPAPPTNKKDTDDRPARGRWLRHTPWQADWAPIAAAPVADDLWAFGTDNGAIAVAQVKDDAWVDRADLALMAASAADSQLLVSSGPAGRAAAQVLWIDEGTGPGGRVIRRATFDGRQWKMLSPMPAPEGAFELVAATTGDTTTMFVRDAEHAIREEHPLLYAEVTGHGDATLSIEPELLPVVGLRDGYFHRTHSMAAGVAGDGISIFLVSHGSLDRADFAAGRIPGRERIEQTPLMKRLEVPLIVGLTIAVYLVFIGFSVRRASRWPDTIEHEGREVKLASWKARVGAFGVDLTFISLIVGLLALVAGTTDWKELVLDWWPLLLIPYFIVLELGQGQTPGKKLFGIAVVTQELLPPGFKHVLVRNMLYVIDLPLVGLVVLLNTKTSQRIGDLLGGTLVVKVPRRRADNEEA